MSKGIFTDKSRKPGPKDIEMTVGRALGNWRELNEFLRSTLKLKGELKFYGVNYGWAIRYSKSGKSVIALYPATDSFTAQIILKREQVKAALTHKLSPEAKDAIDRAHEFNEGRWVYLTVDHKSDLQDILALVNSRLETKS